MTHPIPIAVADDRGGPPLVDIDGLRRDLEAAGVPEIVDELLHVFAAAADGRLRAIIDAMHSGTCDQIAAAAHSYKSGALGVKAHGLSEILSAIERDALDGNLDRAVSHLRPLVAVHEASMDLLEAASPESTH